MRTDGDGARGDGRASLIPVHGGYRNLKSFQVARLAYDVTVRFCDRYIDRKSRTHDQMVQAARSGMQNIAEGSKDSGTSKKIELKLTGIAAGSLCELRLDYEAFLRQRKLPLWPEHDWRRRALVARRCQTADEVAAWCRELKHGRIRRDGLNGLDGRDAREVRRDEAGGQPIASMSSMSFPEIAANAAHVLAGVACALLDRQIQILARDFEERGGFTERLHRVRSARLQRR